MISRVEFLRQSLGLAIFSALPSPIMGCAVEPKPPQDIYIQLMGKKGDVPGWDLDPLSNHVFDVTTWPQRFNFSVEATEPLWTPGIQFCIPNLRAARLVDSVDPLEALIGAYASDLQKWNLRLFRHAKILQPGDAIDVNFGFFFETVTDPTAPENRLFVQDRP